MAEARARQVELFDDIPGRWPSLHYHWWWLLNRAGTIVAPSANHRTLIAHVDPASERSSPLF